MTTMYGIKNCDTIKKARKWLEEAGVEYTFHDYKTQGVPEAQLAEWVSEFGWETILNKRGTTYRKLDDATKDSLNADTAIPLLIEHASMIKRPVLAADNGTLVGFKAEEYKTLFEGK